MKKILYCSNFSKAKTGFGRHARTVLTYLYGTGKYEIVEYAAAPYSWSSPELKSLPWKAYGAIPDNHDEVARHTGNPHFMRQVSYGGWNIDKIVNQEKPDIVIACEDIWAFGGAENDNIKIQAWWDRPWWNKIPCVIWTPVDSLPIFPLLSDNAKKIKNLWVKSEFAEKEMARLGFDHVKTIPALIDEKPFRPLDRISVSKIRNGLGISDDMPVFGFVFRNQLRKLVVTLLEGFKEFKVKNPTSNAKLHLHTNFVNGQWDIPRAIANLQINPNDVLCTYICRKCKKSLIAPFSGPIKNCSACNTENSVCNPDHNFGITEDELNIIYNIYGFNGAYIHPATSGGFEMPLLEAIYAGALAATVPYSFGTSYIDNGIADVIDSDVNVWEEGSMFLKAQPKKNSISDLLEYYASMPTEQRLDISKHRREKALDMFAPDRHLKDLEKFIDEQPETNYNFDFDGINEYMPSIEKMFLPTKKKRLLYTMPASNGDCLVSLSVLESIKRVYPLDDWDIYVATSPQFMEIFKHLEWVNIIPFHPIMENYRYMEGCGGNKGIVDICFIPHVMTQRVYSYHHNGIDTCELQKI